LDRRRVAFHEAGHLIMAFLLHMDVLSCDLGRRKEAPGELGRCVVITPDPVGIRRFLLAMGGVMAEERFFQDEEGGLKDRHDALEALENYLAHYRRRDRDDIERIVALARDLFHSPASLLVIRRAALMLTQKRSLDSLQMDHLRQELVAQIDTGPLIEALEGLTATEEPQGLKGLLLALLNGLKSLILRMRKPFDEP
jgi:hypothetical protein